MAIKIFMHERLIKNRTQEQINQLKADFIQYKRDGIQPSNFGRDEPYDRPASVKLAELRHIHLNYDTGWPLRIARWQRTSNIALVYCEGWHSKENFLLITLLDKAHEQARKTTFMAELAEVAERFRSKY